MPTTEEVLYRLSKAMYSMQRMDFGKWSLKEKQLPHNILEPFLVASHVATGFWQMHSTRGFPTTAPTGVMRTDDDDDDNDDDD